MSTRFLFELFALLACLGLSACSSSTAEQTATVTATATMTATATDMYDELEKLNTTPTASALMLDPCSGIEIVRMEWDTDGGGNIRFVIDKEEAGYRIRVERYDFEAIDQEISFADAKPSVQRIVDTIFANPTYLLRFRYNPDMLTGTWTTITLVCADDQEISYSYLKAWNPPLNDLYVFVEQALLAAEPTP